jgi:hypothetical protein
MISDLQFRRFARQSRRCVHWKTVNENEMLIATDFLAPAWFSQCLPALRFFVVVKVRPSWPHANHKG